MNAKYNKETHSLEEQPEMKEPDLEDYVFFSGDSQRYYDDMQEYLEQKATCKTYPVSGREDSWKNGEVLEEGKDYKIDYDEQQVQYDNGEWSRDYVIVAAAVPIFYPINPRKFDDIIFAPPRMNNMKDIEKLYSALTYEFRSLEKMPHFRNKISGYECALWDLKMIAKELFHIELPKVESSSFNNETS